MAIIFECETDALGVEGDEPRIGDGDAVGVAREIGEHLFGASEGALGVDVPLARQQGFRNARNAVASASAA